MADKLKLKTDGFEPTNFNFDTQKLFDERYLADLVNILKTHSSIPTHTPNKMLDCIHLYYDGTSTYELYLYINNEWKKATLS